MRIGDELSSIERRIDAIAAGPAAFDAILATTLGATRRGDGETAATGTVSRASIDHVIGASASEFGVDPALVAAIVQNESAFDPSATSSVGARGLMQLMPETARSLGVRNAYDPVQNVRGGARYLRGLLDRFGDVELAVAAYNAGPAAVERYGGVPPYAETRKYVRGVLASYRSRKAPY